MMKTIRYRVLAVVLSLALMVGALSACGSAVDPVQDAMGYPGSTEMLTVDGTKITAADLLFWMAQSTDELASYFSAMGGGEIDWSMPMGEAPDGSGSLTAGDMVKEQAKGSAVMYSIVMAKATANGYSLTKEDEAAYEEELANAVAQAGSEESYERWLNSSLLNSEGMKRMSSVGVLFGHMTDGMCREGGQYAPAEGEIAKYAADNDLLCAKHILLLTQDQTTGQSLGEDVKAEKKQKAEEMAAELQAITDPAQLELKFDELMRTHSEDTGLAGYPDGYVFSAGRMVKPFEDGTRALQPGQVSGVIESEFGYHIIYRQDPATAPEMFKQWSTEKMYQIVAQWVDEAEVTTTPAFDELDVGDFYAKLTAYRQTLEAQTQSAEGEQPQDAQPAEGQEAPDQQPAEETQPAQEQQG